MVTDVLKTRAGSARMRLVLRAVGVWLLIMLAETVNGTLRQLFVAPFVGDERARQFSFSVALVLIITITTIFVKWLEAADPLQLLLVGAFWAVLTFLFEFILGVWVLGHPWERFTADYDVSRGGLMLFGLLFMIFAPLLAALLQAVLSRKTSRK